MDKETVAYSQNGKLHSFENDWLIYNNVDFTKKLGTKENLTCHLIYVKYSVF